MNRLVKLARVSLALAFAALLVVIWFVRPREPDQSPELSKLRDEIAAAERLQGEVESVRARIATSSGLARAQAEADLEPASQRAMAAETRVEQLRAVLAARGYDVRGFTLRHLEQ